MTKLQFERELARIDREIARCSTAVQQQEIRRRIREERGMVFVRTYTVPAHFQKPPKRRRA